MLFLTLSNILSILVIICIIRANSKNTRNLPHYSIRTSKATLTYYNFKKYLLLCQLSSTWLPLFKRSSYIGLVWKSNWKL